MSRSALVLVVLLSALSLVSSSTKFVGTTESSLETFYELSVQEKSTLKSFELFNITDQPVNLTSLLENLKYCTNLEQIIFDNVFVGFPITVRQFFLGNNTKPSWAYKHPIPMVVEDKILLPKLQRYEINVINYPRENFDNGRDTVSTLVWFKTQLDKGYEETVGISRTSVKIVTDGNIKLVIDFKSGEITFGDIAFDGELISQLMTSLNNNFVLKELTSRQCYIDTDIIFDKMSPQNLTYYNGDINIINGTKIHSITTEIGDLVQRMPRLRELYLKTFWTNSDKALLSLEKTRENNKFLKTLSVQYMKILLDMKNDSRDSTIEQLYFKDCVLNGSINNLEQFQNLRVFRLIYTDTFEPDNLSDIEEILNVLKTNIPTMELIYITHCQHYWKTRISNSEKKGEENRYWQCITEMDFLWERKRNNDKWNQRMATKEDALWFDFHLRGQSKLQTWKRFQEDGVSL